MAFLAQLGVWKPGTIQKSPVLGSVEAMPPALSQAVAEPSLIWKREYLTDAEAGTVPCQMSKMPVGSFFSQTIGTQWNELSAVSQYLMLALVISSLNTRSLRVTGVLLVGSVGLM